jgi:hypothetical protein
MRILQRHMLTFVVVIFTGAGASAAAAAASELLACWLHMPLLQTRAAWHHGDAWVTLSQMTFLLNVMGAQTSMCIRLTLVG